MKRYFTPFISLLVGVFFSLISIESYARDGRTYIKDAMKQRGACRTVAITETNGDAMIFTNNGYAYSSVPTRMGERIKELNSDGKYITDIHLSESGNWIILYENNGFTRAGLPYGLENLLLDWNNKGYKILSASFDDDGHWIAISEEEYRASDSSAQSWIKSGIYKYGKPISSCISDGIAVIVYEKGYQIMGTAPKGLVSAIKNSSFKVRIIKATKTSWFISDGESAYRYYM